MNTKKIILFLLLNVCILNLYAKEPDFTQENDVILIRHFYVMSTTARSVIKVYKNNNQVETIDVPPVTDDEKNNSFMEIRNVLQKYTSEGYTIIASNEASVVSYGAKFTTTYVLQKK